MQFTRRCVANIVAFDRYQRVTTERSQVAAEYADRFGLSRGGRPERGTGIARLCQLVESGKLGRARPTRSLAESYLTRCSRWGRLMCSQVSVVNVAAAGGLGVDCYGLDG